MSEPYNTVIYNLAKDNESDFFTEENFYLLRWLTMIGKQTKVHGFGFVRDPAHLKGMYKPLMRNHKLSRTNADIRIAVNLWYRNPSQA